MTVEVERFIRIQSAHQRAGGEIVWRTLPICMRLRVWHMAVADALPEELDSQSSLKRMIFHVGYVDGVERGCRVSYLGELFTVLSVSDSTRHRGLELRCAPEG